MTSEGLPRELRLRRRREIEKAYADGAKAVTPDFAVYVRANCLPHTRLAVTATRRLGSAVQRNRARRLIREAFRTHRAGLPAGYDLVVVARPAILRRRPREIGPMLADAVRRALGRSAGR